MLGLRQCRIIIKNWIHLHILILCSFICELWVISSRYSIIPCEIICFKYANCYTVWIFSFNRILENHLSQIIFVCIYFEQIYFNNQYHQSYHIRILYIYLSLYVPIRNLKLFSSSFGRITIIIIIIFFTEIYKPTKNNYDIYIMLGYHTPSYVYHYLSALLFLWVIIRGYWTRTNHV